MTEVTYKIQFPIDEGWMDHSSYLSQKEARKKFNDLKSTYLKYRLVRVSESVLEEWQ